MGGQQFDRYLLPLFWHPTAKPGKQRCLPKDFSVSKISDPCEGGIISRTIYFLFIAQLSLIRIVSRWQHGFGIKPALFLINVKYFKLVKISYGIMSPSDRVICASSIKPFSWFATIFFSKCVSIDVMPSNLDHQNLCCNIHSKTMPGYFSGRRRRKKTNNNKSR